jgi:DNA-binding SARP family transcriptional activator
VEGHPAPLARLGLLGDFELTFELEPVRVLTAPQRILALLAVVHRGRPTARQALAERLWSTTSSERAAANLRSALWRMPRPRGRTLVLSNASTVRLSTDLGVDLWDAEGQAQRLFAPETETSLTSIDLALLSRDLLPSWDEEWLLVEQESYRQKRLHALERTSGVMRQQERFTDALTAALEAVRSEPLRESAHRMVIEVHLIEGNSAEALRQYENFRRLLAFELGLPPSPAIRQLVQPLLGRPNDTPSV